jgi:hypothetical protein
LLTYREVREFFTQFDIVGFFVQYLSDDCRGPMSTQNGQLHLSDTLPTISRLPADRLFVNT